MKIYIFILALFTNCSLSLAQSSISNLYKQWMIDDINKEAFDRAIQDMNHVEEWSLKAGNIQGGLNINKALAFLHYADSVCMVSPSCDSLRLYVVEEAYSKGITFYNQGEYNNAIDYFLIAADLQKKVRGEQDLDYAASLNNLGVLYTVIGDYTQAESYYLESLQIKKSILGEKHSDYAQTLNNLGVLYLEMGDYLQAESYYLESLQIRQSVLGEQHPDYAASLDNLGNLYSEKGDYAQAYFYYLESLQIRKTTLGKYHLDCATSMGNLGVLHCRMGNYLQAESYYLESMQIRKKVLGKLHPDYATSLHNLGVFYHNVGDYSQAGLYYLEALQIRKSVLGEQHPDYASLLDNLGVLYCNMGDYHKAESFYLESLQIMRSVLGEKHPEYVGLLRNLGDLYRNMGDYIQAESYYLEALQIMKSVLGELHPEYAGLLLSLGNLFFDYGVYMQAESYYLEALQIMRSVLGEQHSVYIATLNNIGLLYLKIGDYVKAESYAKQSMLLNKNRYIQSTNYMSEKQRSMFWTTMQDAYLYVYPTLAYRYYITKPSISTFAYNNELFVKGLLLYSSNLVQSSILHSNDTMLIQQWEDLRSMKQQILNLSESNPQSHYLQELQAQAERLEKTVILSSSSFRKSRDQWNIEWDSVRASLTDGEVAIEYFLVPLYNSDSTIYCALLLHSGSPHPQLIPLFEEQQALALIHTTNESQTNLTYSYNVEDGDTIGYGARLTELVWSKIIPYIREGETLYFAPSGLLHQLAIEALPYDENRTMADVFNLVRLSSTREIVLNKPQSTHTTATLYGGIQYNMSGDEILAESAQYTTTSLFASRGIDNDTLNRGNIDYLPYTKVEVEEIDQQLKQNDFQVQRYTATNANEESFKALSGTYPNILHIATHGFYWSDSTAQQKDYFSQRHLMMGSNMPQRPTIDPLNRCGLLLAGAQTAWSGHSADLPEGVQDGVLTAKEISLLDLRGCDLVVLSACETGKGEITGEGVFGLQRAFKMAGVQTIIMSLWRVNDRATKLLMTEFYRNWITLRQSKREAFRNAQNTVRSQHPEPYYWAGFIMLD